MFIQCIRLQNLPSPVDSTLLIYKLFLKIYYSNWLNNILLAPIFFFTQEVERSPVGLNLCDIVTFLMSLQSFTQQMQSLIQENAQHLICSLYDQYLY